MSLVLTRENNFVRVLAMRKEFPKGFCHGGGLPVVTRMVDWFKPVPEPLFFDESKDFDGVCLLPNMEERPLPYEDILQIRKQLTKFIQQKDYYRSNLLYICITRYGDTFTINYEGE